MTVRTVLRRLPSSVLLLAGSLAVASACAKARPVVTPGPITTPRFPEFVFPAIPSALAVPAASAAHQAGWQWLQLGDLRNADRSFASALKASPQFYPAEAGLGLVALAHKDARAAAGHFDRALVADPSYAPALAGRGEALLALGQRDAALASFESAVGADATLGDLRARIEVLRFRGLEEDVNEARKAAEAGRLDDAQRSYERSLAASPDSPFLYRELAAVERRNGRIEAALQHAEKAVELNPSEARSFITLGEVYEAQGAFAEAADAYGRAVGLEPSAAVDARIDAIRERAAFAAMPEDYRTIEASPAITRAQLAALVGVRLAGVVKRARRDNAVVLTDTRGSWAGPWILSVSRAGLMEAYPNHTFQPDAIVSRGDLAVVAARALAVIGADRPDQAAAWRRARPRFPDLPAGHLSYPAAAMAVQAGVMSANPDGAFQLTRPVTGAEAVRTIDRLEELSGRRSP